jgi:AraC-like DNA-binding protein
LNARAPAEWTRYRRAPELGGEAMAAHFVAHVYHRHSHDTYSFGVTDDGAQAFRCRGASHVSTAGLVMAFNPDDPHDGHAGEPGGFTYRMVHVDPETVREVLAGAGLPLFASPVVHDPELASRVRRAADAVLGGADPLAAQEALDALVVAAGRHATGAVSPAPATTSPVEQVRDLLHARFAEPVTAAELALTAGRSRFQVYRLFRQQYGLSPSGYVRQLRLRAARRALAAREPVAAVAAATGFADQAHLTRWFRRTYGITPAIYQRACADGLVKKR